MYFSYTRRYPPTGKNSHLLYRRYFVCQYNGIQSHYRRQVQRIQPGRSYWLSEKREREGGGRGKEKMKSGEKKSKYTEREKLTNRELERNT